MEALILYRPKTDYERTVIDFQRDYNLQTGKTIESVDVDSPRGEQLCQLYDIMEYPAVIVVDDRGGLHNLWRGLPLPRIDDVSYGVQG